VEARHPLPTDLADSMGNSLICKLFVWDWIPPWQRTGFLPFYIYWNSISLWLRIMELIWNE